MDGMLSSTEIVLNTFLSALPSEKKNRLIERLPDSWRSNAENFIPAPPLVTSELSLLERVHWSWFLPTLRTYSSQEQIYFLASLAKEAASRLAKALPAFLDLREITPLAQRYFRKILLDTLLDPKEPLLPIAYLPTSSLNALLEHSKEELLELIDVLAMHDLSQEFRQIVETKMLRRIYSFLTESQRLFLKHLSGKQESFSLPRLRLDRWDGESQSLRHLLHRRGLLRLSIALSTQHPDLIWYICHVLDIGRGSALFRLCSKEHAALFPEPAMRQVEELLMDL